MQKERLCFDIDNVLAQTDNLIRRLIKEFTYGRVNLAYEHVIEFDYHKCKDADGKSITRSEWTEIHKLFCEAENLRKVDDVPGVREHLISLSEYFEIHFATSRLPSSRKATIEWLEAHAFPPHALHLLNHHKKHECLSGFVAVVEDNYEEARAFAEGGIQSYLIKHPWNINKPPCANLYWVDGWQQLLERLMTQMRETIGRGT